MKRILLLVLGVHSLTYGQNIIPEKVGEEIYKSFSSPHPFTEKLLVPDTDNRIEADFQEDCFLGVAFCSLDAST